MLSRFFPPKCPITDQDREWVEARYAWLFDTFGDDGMWRDIRLPTPEHFPERFDGAFFSLQSVVNRIANHLDVDVDRLQLEVFENERHPIRYTGLEGSWKGSGPAGYYEEGAAWTHRAVIGIDAAIVTDPTAVVATLAHEVCHALLLGYGYVAHEEPDMEPLTDLATIFFGLGVFTANGLVRETQWQSAGWSGWSTGKAGYLNFPIIGYTLALHARFRGEAKPSWRKYLRPDARSAFDRAARYLKSRGPVA